MSYALSYTERNTEHENTNSEKDNGIRSEISLEQKQNQTI